MLLKEGQREYEAFKIWYEEGSTLAQRMMSANADPPEPPNSWLEYRQIFRAMGASALPPTMKEAAKMLADFSIAILKASSEADEAEQTDD